LGRIDLDLYPVACERRTQAPDADQQIALAGADCDIIFGGTIDCTGPEAYILRDLTGDYNERCYCDECRDINESGRSQRDYGRRNREQQPILVESGL
jgi:hypothetical protein